MTLATTARKGFTLIELLVVIAIIALLIGILLPALGKARQAGWKAVSMSNLRQLMLGVEQYKADVDGRVPYPPCKRPVTAICTWTYGGKDTSENWASGQNLAFDISASARPLNAYLYPEIVLPPPRAGTYDWDWRDGTYKMGKPDVPRQAIELEGYRSPGDKISYQNDWPKPDYEISSYDDVGTSYHTNLRWFYEMEELAKYQGNNGWERAFDDGIRRMEMAADFDTSRFVFIHDQTADISTQDDNRVPPEGIMGEFGEMNKSCMAFFDGHVEYLQITLREPNTQEYQLHFVLPGDN